MKWHWLAIAILWLGFGVRVWGLDTESIWHDEGWSIRAIHSPLGTPDDNTPYVYYTIGHVLWLMGAGNSPFALRYVSVLLGLLTVAVALRLGRGWLGKSGSITFGVLIALSPLLWEYAQEVRAYVMVPLIALLLMGWLEALLQYQPNTTIPVKLWVAVWITEVVGLYTHNLAVPLVIWASVAVGLVWLWRQDWNHLFTWAQLHVLLMITYVPWLLTQSPSGTTLNTPPEIGLPLIRDIWYSYFLPALPQLQAADTPLLIIIAAILALISSVILLWQHSIKGWVIASNALLVPVFSTGLLLAANIDFHPRYFIAGVPAAMLLLVAGFNALPHQNMKLLLNGGVMVLVGLISYNSLHDISTTRTYQHDDFAALAEYYATLPSDAVIIIPFDDEPALQYYFADEYNIQAQFINVPLHSDRDLALRSISRLVEDAPRHVEFLTWFQLPADVRGMYPCLLGSNSQSVGDVQAVYGLSTQAFILRDEPFIYGLTLDAYFAEGQLDNLSYMASDAGVCVFGDWYPRTDANETSTAAQILSPIGTQIADDDTVIRDDKQQSDFAQFGSLYHWLPLPAGTPLGDYELTLTIYTNDSPSGFDVIRDDNIVGKLLRPQETIRTRGPQLDPTTDAPQLLADSLGEPANIDSGLSFDVTVLVDNAESIQLVGDGWQIEQDIIRDPQQRIQRSWHIFTTPPDASGEAILQIGDVILKTITINPIERITEQPASDSATTDVVFEGIGNLVGYSVISPYEIILVWQATTTTEIPYIVFVQFIGTDGRVIAQSDRQPANAQRPTTSWLSGEYILDNHQLSLNVDQYSGSGKLIVGFYDPQTFQRVFTADGQQFYELPDEYLVD